MASLNASNFPNGFNAGVNIRGVPILNTYGGSVFWVDSGAAAPNANAGSFNHPCTTVNQALDLCTANNGDVVICKAGHNEALTAATDVVMDVAGVTLLGMGNGSDRPHFDFDGTAGSFEIDAANTTIENVVFRASVTAVVVGVNVDAADVTLRNCEWTFEATGDDFIIMVDVDTVNNCTITGCRFKAENAAGADHAIRLDTAHYAQITDCWIHGDFAAGAITSEGAASSEILIKNVDIFNADTAFTTGNCIDLTVADTGLIAYCNLGSRANAAIEGALLDPGSCAVVEVYGTNDVDEHAIVLPEAAASST